MLGRCSFLLFGMFGDFSDHCKLRIRHLQIKMASDDFHRGFSLEKECGTGPVAAGSGGGGLAPDKVESRDVIALRGVSREAFERGEQFIDEIAWGRPVLPAEEFLERDIGIEQLALLVLCLGDAVGFTSSESSGQIWV